MLSIFLWWGISAVVLVVAAGRAGRGAQGSVLGIFLDSRGRFSLSQFQMVLWTVVVLSLLAGVFLARVFRGVSNPLNITIPSELLIAMGISVGSTVTATAIKAGKDLRNILVIGRNQPKFSQVYLAEEGTTEVVDVTKFQNFWLTMIAVSGYLAAAASMIRIVPIGADPYPLSGFNTTLLTLLGISHAGYLAGKLPDKK